MDDLKDPNLMKFKNINVIYTANLKGNLDEISRMATLVNEAKEKNKPYILLNLGNTSWGDDACNYFKGEPAWKTIKIVGYDGLLPGPDDFLHGWKNLTNFIPRFGVPATLCNLYSRDKDSRITEEIKPYLIINKYFGLKIGLIGIIDEKIEFERENAVFLEYADNAALWGAKKLKEEGCNYIILMAYASMEKCVDISLKVRDIDLIICGDPSQPETTEMIDSEGRLISCENTKGGKLTIINIDIGEM